MTMEERAKAMIGDLAFQLMATSTQLEASTAEIEKLKAEVEKLSPKAKPKVT